LDRQFWYDRWESSRIGFHNSKPNPSLVAHVQELSLNAGDRVFLPLCGKTLDIGWLLAKGFQVVGAELSKIAIEQLFAEMEITPEVNDLGDALHYSAPMVDIFVGDIFDMTREMVGRIDAVYDRAALVALPVEMRKRYAKHLVELTNKAPQLLLTFTYDQAVMDGPPFSISEEEIKSHYDAPYTLLKIESHDVPGGLKGVCPAEEHVWHLK